MAAPRDTPNVLLLLTDQERADLTDPDGLPAETPTIDDIARGGVRFDRAYTPTSICSSARASLLTGLFPHNHGLLNNVHGADAIRTDLAPDLPTLGELLREAGYTNTYVGKWHVGRTMEPGDFGFEYFGGSDSHHDEHLDTDFRTYRQELGVDRDTGIADAITKDRGEGTPLAGRDPGPVEASRPYFIAERTIQCLEAAARRDGPFFHRTDFLGPHHPYVIPDPYASMYTPTDLDPWPSYAETFDGKPQVHENYTAYRGVDEFEWDRWAELLAKYMGFMTLIDEQIGRILSALDDLGLRDNTLVVHTSDHGDFVGSHRQFNKGPLMYEDTYRIPLIASGPGIDGNGRTCEAFVSLADLMPTFLELGDAAIPDGLDGRSFHTLLTNSGDHSTPRADPIGSTDRDGTPNPEENPRRAAFAEYHGDEFGLYSQRMVRTPRYKFVYNVPDVDELYDLQHDPHELQNLADHPGYRGVRDRLESWLLAWMDQSDDPLHHWTSTHLAG